jgi:hypothetical protein
MLVIASKDVVGIPESWMATMEAFCPGKETISGIKKLLSKAMMENKTIAKVPYRMDLS